MTLGHGTHDARGCPSPLLRGRAPIPAFFPLHCLLGTLFVCSSIAFICINKVLFYPFFLRIGVILSYSRNYFFLSLKEEHTRTIIEGQRTDFLFICFFRLAALRNEPRKRKQPNSSVYQSVHAYTSPVVLNPNPGFPSPLPLASSSVDLRTNRRRGRVIGAIRALAVLPALGRGAGEADCCWSAACGSSSSSAKIPRKTTNRFLFCDCSCQRRG